MSGNPYFCSPFNDLLSLSKFDAVIKKMFYVFPPYQANATFSWMPGCNGGEDGM
jgi:hypothetical protein